MKEWTVYYLDSNYSEDLIFADDFELWFHNETSEWYWKFSDGSMIPSRLVRAIINTTSE